MTSRRRPLLLALAVAVLATGCSFHSGQLEAARRALARSEGGVDALAAHAWRASFLELQTRLYAVDAEDGIVFADRFGTRLGFDGWDLVAGGGLPNAIRGFRVRREGDGLRVHEVDGLGSFAVICDDPQRTAWGWRTRCRHETEAAVIPMVHRLVLDAGDRIVRIEATILPGAAPLVLEREDGGTAARTRHAPEAERLENEA
ncbi:MAG: hypothetical protein V2J02_14370 [Pseudomonadales bacterium]|nr:hypothetical protein [Pseudomonadales bacterium]